MYINLIASSGIFFNFQFLSVSYLCLFSFPNKQKTSDSSTTAMTSALGSNLSELDRLLLELNAVQQSSPSFPTTGRDKGFRFIGSNGIEHH